MLRCEKGTQVRYWLTLASGMVECLGFAGIIFGWASLVFILKTEGYFSQLCINSTTANSTITINCSGQDEQLSLVFTIATFLTNFFLLPIGFYFDRFGTLATRLLAILLHTTGILCVAFSSSATSNLMFPALSFIAVGGVLYLMTNMQVGNLFGARRSTIVTLYNGAFDSSSAVFLIVKVLFADGISLQASFLFLSACSIIHLLRTLFLMPKSHIPHPIPEGYTYGLGCSRTTSFDINRGGQLYPIQNVQRDRAVGRESPQKEEPQCSVEENKVPSIKSCLLSWFFLWHVVWLSITQLRHLIFIGTLNPLLNRLAGGNQDLVSSYTNAFAITQMCGVLCAPWNGLIMDRHKGKPRDPGESEWEADLHSSVLSLFLTATQCLLFCLCATIPVLPMQYLTFVIQVINRSFLYGGNAAFINIAFPSCHFGKLYGLMMALSALASLLQYLCFFLMKKVLVGDPLYLNVALTLLTLFVFIHPAYVYVHCRRLAAQRTKQVKEVQTA